MNEEEVPDKGKTQVNERKKEEGEKRMSKREEQREESHDAADRR